MCAHCVHSYNHNFISNLCSGMFSCLERKLFPSIDALGEKIKFAFMLLQLCCGKVRQDARKHCAMTIQKTITLPGDPSSLYAVLAFHCATQISPFPFKYPNSIPVHTVKQFGCFNCALNRQMKCGQLSAMYPRQ